MPFCRRWLFTPCFSTGTPNILDAELQILADLREIQDTYASTNELEETLRELDEQMNRDADAIQDLIATNARVAQNQDDYNAKYDALVSSFEAVKKRRDEVAGEIRQKGIRRREFARFIAAVEKLPNEVTEFEESMWSDLVESMTVHAKDDIRFILPCETEIKA